MLDTLAITYEGSSEVKHNKLSLLTHKYELFRMEKGEDIQTIMNELRYLGRHYDNYDHVDKILQSLSRKLRSHVISLRATKNLDSMTLEELIGILKVYEQELAQDEGTKKRKSLALTVQRPKRNSTSKESSSKVYVVNDASKEESNDDDSNEEDDELSMITRRTRKMWKNNNSSRFNSLSKRSFHKKEKIPIIYYECKKPRHFKSKCLDLEKSKDKKKNFFE